MYTKHKNETQFIIFDDSCEEVLQSKSFATLATAGRHKKVSVIFIKRNLYQQGRFSVTVDKGTTHVILTMSPRIGQQLKVLGSELDTAIPSFFVLLQGLYESSFWSFDD